MSTSTTARPRRGRPPATPEQKAEWDAQREQRLQLMQAQLASRVQALATSDEWKRTLTFAAQFGHRYSARNLLLIEAQMPGATHVAPFGRWRKYGRAVKKGEKGLYILAPMKGARDVEDAQTGETTRVGVMRGFKTEAVFDVSQTEGAEIPGITTPRVAGDGDPELLEQLLHQIRLAGFTVEFTETIPGRPGAEGLTQFTARKVLVCSGMSPAHTQSVVAHELAHVMLHDPQDPDAKVSRRQGEVEAESVAWVVLAARGVDTAHASDGYLAGWAGEDLDVLERTARRVLDCSRSILRGADPEAPRPDDGAVLHG